MSHPQRICLCGFMGAGKTSVGQALATLLSYSFADLDSEIEEEFGIAVPEIFRRFGEAAFRRAEVMHGQSLLERTNIVIALGGGALTNESLTDAISERGLLVYLKATPETLYERIQTDSHRPLLEGVGNYAEFLKVYSRHMDLRRAGYARSHVTVCTDDQNVKEIVKGIAESAQSE